MLFVVFVERQTFFQEAKKQRKKGKLKLRFQKIKEENVFICMFDVVFIVFVVSCCCN
jgi:hypothetical protein